MKIADDEDHLFINDFEYEDEVGSSDRSIDPKRLAQIAERQVCPTLRENVSTHHLDYEEIDVFNPKTNRWIMGIKLWQMPSEIIIDQAFLDLIEAGLTKWETYEHKEAQFGDPRWKGALELGQSK